MFNKKIIFSLIVFIFFMIVTSTIKNGTRIIEKNIYNNQKRISILKNNLYELQLDYSYLTSPELISQKILARTLVILKLEHKSFQIYNMHEIFNSVNTFDDIFKDSIPYFI